MLAKELEYIAANKVMAAVVGNAENINDTEGVVLDSKGVILDYQVLLYVSRALIAGVQDNGEGLAFE